MFRSPINTKKYYFERYPEKLKLRRTLKPHGILVTKKKQKADAARKKTDQPNAIVSVVVRSFLRINYSTLNSCSSLILKSITIWQKISLQIFVRFCGIVSKLIILQREKCERIQTVMDRLSEKAVVAQNTSLNSSSSVS